MVDREYKLITFFIFKNYSITHKAAGIGHLTNHGDHNKWGSPRAPFTSERGAIKILSLTVKNQHPTDHVLGFVEVGCPGPRSCRHAVDAVLNGIHLIFDQYSIPNHQINSIDSLLAGQCQRSGTCYPDRRLDSTLGESPQPSYIHHREGPLIIA